MLVKQAANVIDILEYFAKRKGPATLSEVAADMGWPRSSTFNLISTLADKGYLYEPRTRGGYYPSPRWLTTAQSIADAEPLPDSLLTLATEMTKETGETTAICAYAGTHIIILHVQESSQSIRYYAQAGNRVPIYASSAGRAILTQFTKAERMSIYRKIKFEQFTDTTLTSIEALEEELRRAQERGYHQSYAEYIPDLAGVAFPLPLSHRKLSLVVAGPVSRCLERRPFIADSIEKGIARFSRELQETSL